MTTAESVWFHCSWQRANLAVKEGVDIVSVCEAEIISLLWLPSGYVIHHICLSVSTRCHECKVFSVWCSVRNEKQNNLPWDLLGDVTQTTERYFLCGYSQTYCTLPVSLYSLTPPCSLYPSSPLKVNTASSGSRGVTWGHRLPRSQQPLHSELIHPTLSLRHQPNALITTASTIKDSFLSHRHCGCMSS